MTVLLTTTLKEFTLKDKHRNNKAALGALELIFC